MKYRIMLVGLIGSLACAAACGGDNDDPASGPANGGSAGTAGGATAGSGLSGSGGAPNGTAGSAGDAGAPDAVGGNAGADSTAGGSAGSGGSSAGEAGAAGIAGSGGAAGAAGAGNQPGPRSCKDILAAAPSAKDGKYNILLDLDGNEVPEEVEVSCDMKTAGGGWTLIYSTQGTDNHVPITSDKTVLGNPLEFQDTNRSRALKVALSKPAREVLFVRKDVSKFLIVKGRGADADRPLPFSDKLLQPEQSEDLEVSLTVQDGAETPGFMGYSNYQIGHGGDFNLSQAPAGEPETCLSAKVRKGVDHHSTNYRQLNCSCVYQYLYSYSGGVAEADGDAGYDWNIPLGAWPRTEGCQQAEGGTLVFRVAVR